MWLYYVGVAVRSDVPYQLAIGLAVSDDGLAFERVDDRTRAVRPARMTRSSSRRRSCVAPQRGTRCGT